MAKKYPQRRQKTSKQILEGVTSGRKSLQDPKIVDPKNRKQLAKKKAREPLMEKEVYKVIDWMKEGRSTASITEELRETINERTQKKYAPRFVENIVTAANQLLNMYYKGHIHQIERLHIARYNQIIVEKLNKDYKDLEAAMPPWVLAGIIAGDLADALQAMKQKETLLGMHRKTFRLIFNTQNNVVVKKPKENQLDITLLSLEEQVEMLEIIQIASRSENEVYGVILSQPKEEKTEDVEVELIENNNVQQIEQYVKKDNSNPGSTLIDIQKQIQEKLLKAAQNR